MNHKQEELLTLQAHQRTVAVKELRAALTLLEEHDPRTWSRPNAKYVATKIGGIVGTFRHDDVANSFVESLLHSCNLNGTQYVIGDALMRKSFPPTKGGVKP